jgi:hypothetical protein
MGDDEKMNQWYLTYYFRNVPAAPADFFIGLKTHGIGRSLAEHQPEVDYLVDAHTGKVLLYWSSVPTALVRCEGIDEDGVSRKFFGDLNAQGAFELSDTLNRVRTIDFSLQDIETAAPRTTPISNDGNNFTGLQGLCRPISMPPAYRIFCVRF